MRYIVFSIILILSSATPVHAGYSLCNLTGYVLSAAAGFTQDTGPVTRGWWELRPGQCRIVLTADTAPGRYFVYAETIPGHRGPLRTWSGETVLCVGDGNTFDITDQDTCRDNPARQRKFHDVEVSADANGVWQSNFTEAASYNIHSAQVAGVQRLLNDTGEYSIRIDGTMGQGTRQAVREYRRRKNIPGGSGIDSTLVDSLVQDAGTRQAGLGLFMCNRTPETVWSAIAESAGKETFSSRGWWKLEPDACIRVIRDNLQQGDYYVYGVMESEAGDIPLAADGKTFCISLTAFDISGEQSCRERYLDEAAFTGLDTDGMPSATFSFLPEMFSPLSPQAPSRDREQHVPAPPAN